MTTAYATLQQQLPQQPATWLVTGVAGFIVSSLLESVIKLDQRVAGLDTFATRHQRNLDEANRVAKLADSYGRDRCQTDTRAPEVGANRL